MMYLGTVNAVDKQMFGGPLVDRAETMITAVVSCLGV
jgi:hypothetical protein